MHLSRFAEEIVIWCSAPWRFIRLSDAFTTGSSIMPQKRNPDAAELVRAKTGRITGALVGLLTVMKGLPLAYAKDMQEDKEPVFDAAEAWGLSLAAIAGMVRDMTPDTARMRELAGPALPPQPIWRTGWCACCRCRFATRTTSPDGWWRRPRQRAVDLAGLTWRKCRRRSSASPPMCSPS